MKKLYELYPTFDESDCLSWKILEQATSQVVAEFWFEDDAQEYCQFLEKGGAFAGFTPSFILTNVPKHDINDAFAAEFAE